MLGTASIHVSPVQAPSMIETENKNLRLKSKSNEVNAISKFGNYGGGLLSCQIVRVGVIIGERENEGKWGENEREERE